MNSRKPRKDIKIKNDSGYTLIEVMVAVMIFSIGFLAVSFMQINAMTTTNSAQKTTIAMSVADSQVEWLRTLPFYDKVVTGGNVDNFVMHADLAAGTHEDDVDGPYVARWTVTYDQPLPPNSMVPDTAGVPVTRSMTILVWVTKDGDPADEVQAEIEFAKFPGQLM